MSRWSGGISVAIAVVLAAGCAPEIHYVQMIPPPRPLHVRVPADVELFVVTPPARPHLDIGLVQVVRHSGDESVEQMTALLRAAAAQHGCDALLVIAVDMHIQKYSSGSVEGSCEIYTDVLPADAARPPEVPASGPPHT